MITTIDEEMIATQPEIAIANRHSLPVKKVATTAALRKKKGLIGIFFASGTFGKLATNSVPLKGRVSPQKAKTSKIIRSGTPC